MQNRRERAEDRRSLQAVDTLLLKKEIDTLEKENASLKLQLAQQCNESSANSFCMMPRNLTAENGAKAAFMGQFSESIEITCPSCEGEFADNGENNCEECGGTGFVQQKVPVSWSTVKEIYKKAVDLFCTPQDEKSASQ